MKTQNKQLFKRYLYVLLLKYYKEQFYLNQSNDLTDLKSLIIDDAKIKIIIKSLFSINKKLLNFIYKNNIKININLIISKSDLKNFIDENNEPANIINHEILLTIKLKNKKMSHSKNIKKTKSFLDILLLNTLKKKYDNSTNKEDKSVEGFNTYIVKQMEASKKTIDKAVKHNNDVLQAIINSDNATINSFDLNESNLTLNLSIKI